MDEKTAPYACALCLFRPNGTKPHTATIVLPYYTIIKRQSQRELHIFSYLFNFYDDFFGILHKNPA